MFVASSDKESGRGTMEPHLAIIVRAQYGNSPWAEHLFTCLLSTDEAETQFEDELVRVAKDPQIQWNVRCASVLLLEHQMLRELGNREIERDDCARYLAPLGLWKEGSPVRQELQSEGYTATDPATLLKQLRDRLRRLDRIHRGIRGGQTTPRSLLDFILVSRQECKLSLARYLFDPSEVASRILELIRSTPGRRLDDDPERILAVSRDSPHCQIADFDRHLLRYLRARSRVLWVRSETPAKLNSLVEYPIGTVALAIKPPGGDQEFEVKRVGLRGAKAIAIVYRRDGVLVPPSHRLQGLSFGPMLESEALAGARFAAIYVGVHGTPPPASRIVDLTEITAVPAADGSRELLEYLNNEAVFGPGFAEMRNIMRQAVEDFDRTVPSPDLVGRLGWTIRFLFHTAPKQAWVVGTSSFRIDRTALYLSPAGPQAYFGQGLGQDFTPEDSRRFADELLEEVLGTFSPPEQCPERFEDYVTAVFAQPSTRQTADSAYLNCMMDLGKYCGTLWGVGGYSDGESFVGRNIGLKSLWTDASWRVRICFMDHDCLVVPMHDTPVFRPRRALLGICRDEGHILGTADGPKPCRGAVGHLGEIYRASPETQTIGLALFRNELANAFGETRFTLKNQARAHRATTAEFVQSLFAWDRVVQLYLSQVETGAATDTWKTEARLHLRAKNYSDLLLDEFIESVEKYSLFLRHYCFLYDSKYKDLSRS